MKAVLLILKQATLSYLSDLSPKLALTYAEVDYQKANIDSTIQEHLTASSQEHSHELFLAFIMATDIGLLFASVKIISHLVSAESTHVPPQSSDKTHVHKK